MSLTCRFDPYLRRYSKSVSSTSETDQMHSKSVRKPIETQNGMQKMSNINPTGRELNQTTTNTETSSVKLPGKIGRCSMTGISLSQERAPKWTQKNSNTTDITCQHINTGTETSYIKFQGKVGRHPPTSFPLNQSTTRLQGTLRSNPRLKGGANNPAERKVEHVIKSISLCTIVPPGSAYRLPNPTVHQLDVKLDETTSKPKLQRHLKCEFYEGAAPKVENITKKSKGTKTLYRESSLQTLPFLPDIKNQDECLKHLEVYRLPKELPNDHPPEKRDVEELDRVRKRWAYAQALKAKKKHELEECRDATIKPDKTVLEAFEWERWTEREQELLRDQMQRFDYVLGMFEKREKKIHTDSEARIANSYERIQAEYLKKSRDIERKHKAEIRQKNLRSQRIPRTWRKQNIAEAFGHPGSEQYGPQMRYGNDPARRNYLLKKNRDYERRLDDLDKQDLHMTKLKCSYAKLNAWTKRKGETMEVERDFCTDNNLKIMYEELRGLREQATGKRKLKPKCLHRREWKPKRKSLIYPVADDKCDPVVTSNYDMSVHESVISMDDNTDRRLTEEREKLEKELNDFRNQIAMQKMKVELVRVDMKKEETDALYLAIEGQAFGWILRFLSEEWERLREMNKARHLVLQMQLHRWQREGMEAGLRQKENELRAFYQQLNVVGNKVLLDKSEEFVFDLVVNDMKEHAADDAGDTIVDVARNIDEDLQRWSKAFDKLWDAETTDMLSQLLKDTIYPDEKNLVKHREAELMSRYIMERVVFPKVGRNLETYDISTYTANEIVDRVIDNDLYLVSSDSSWPCTCGEKICSCYTEEKEAKAIMRKLIRRAVPGRRWKTETERIVSDALFDSLDQIFAQMTKRGLFDYKSQVPYIKYQASHWDMLNKKRGKADLYIANEQIESVELAVVKLGDLAVVQQSQIMGELKHEENLMTSDSDSNEVPVEKIKEFDKVYDERDTDLGFIGHYWLKEVASTYDIASIADEFLSRRVSTQASSIPSQAKEIFGSKALTRPIDVATEYFVERLINKVIRGIIPTEETDSRSDKSIDEEVEAKLSGSSITLVQPFKYEDSSESSKEATEYEFEINQSEYDRMESDICKCTAELEREEHVRELIKAGKVRVLPKICLDVSNRARRGSQSLGSESEYGFPQTRELEKAKKVKVSPKTCLDVSNRARRGSTSYSLDSASEYGLKIIRVECSQTKTNVKISVSEKGESLKVMDVDEDIKMVTVGNTKEFGGNLREIDIVENDEFKDEAEGFENAELTEGSEELNKL